MMSLNKAQLMIVFMEDKFHKILFKIKCCKIKFQFKKLLINHKKIHQEVGKRIHNPIKIMIRILIWIKIRLFNLKANLYFKSLAKSYHKI